MLGNSLAMEEGCDRTSNSSRKREHVELVMNGSCENDQHSANYNRDERKRNDWEFYEVECASQYQQAGGDGKNAEAVPPDGTA
ncbi:MAG: hypothetical protein NVSMB6_29180 [Burkholderiaceae bacterium]